MNDPREPAVDYVFGYGSLVALREPLQIGESSHPPLVGRLRGFRRLWGAAMDNWDAVNDPKHFLERETRQRPHVRIAYLDIEASEGETVNGVAIPVDAPGLVELDAREVNYARVDVTDAFEANVEGTDAFEASVEVTDAFEASVEASAEQRGAARVFTYVATEAARARCRAGAAESNVCVSAEYVARVREAFAGLGDGALAEFERTTAPLPFPERDLEMVLSP